jgi:hypothetical protein
MTKVNFAVAIVAGVFLASFVFGVMFKYLPSPEELVRDATAECRQSGTVKQLDTEKPEDKAARQKEINDCLLAAYTGSLSNFTRWLVLATAVVAFFGFWQVMVTRRAARKQLRAYVSVEPEGISIYNPPDRVLARVRFHNTGSVFARHAFTSINCELSEDGERKVFEEGTASGKNVIAPRATILRGTDKAIFKRDIDARRCAAEKSNRQLYLYVWGIVRYDDGFTGGRFTKYCHRYNLSGTPKGEYIIPPENYRYHQDGNEIDDKD